MFIRITLALVSLVLTSMAMAAQLSVTLAVSPGSGGNTPFAALHTYYISPTGSDGSNGISAATAWATANYKVVCGDVIIAAAGSYTSQFQQNKWGTVSNCPSTTGGIDGTGGVYFATVLCAGPVVTSCSINGGGGEAARVDASNWAMEGFTGTNTPFASTNCFTASSSVSLAGTSLHHIAFINDIASTCGGDGFDTYPEYQDTGSGSVDQTAVVGVIAYAAAQSNNFCNSGVSLIPTNGPDTSAGTHVFAAGVFAYNNMDGPVCAGFNATDVTAPIASPGVIHSKSFFTAGEPITFNVSGGSLPAPLNTKTVYYVCLSGLTANVSFELSTTVNCVTPINFTTGGTGTIGALTQNTSDGEGIILDLWGLQSFSHQGAVEQSVAWANGSNGFEIFPNGGTDGANVFITGVTAYGDMQDKYHFSNNGQEVNFQQVHVAGTAIKSIVNSIAKATSIIPPGSAASQCSQANLGCPIYAMTVAGSPVTQSDAIITGNYFKGLATSCQGWSCDPSNTLVVWDGNTVPSVVTNTIGDPGFANPTALPKTAPSCGAYTNVTDCMNIGAGVAAALTPSGGAAGKGYQPPGPCAPDSLYPTWLKGIVYLHWNGSALTENAGLITKPCGL